jgi:hypothetical protein
VFISVQRMIYLVFFLHMVNTGALIEICACEVVWRMNNSRKSTIFCDVLYHLNVIFLQCFFEGLKIFFSISNKRARREISNGVSHLSNRDFMRNLQHKQ